MGLQALLLCICSQSVLDKLFGGPLIDTDCRISQQEAVGEEVSKNGVYCFSRHIR